MTAQSHLFIFLILAMKRAKDVRNPTVCTGDYSRTTFVNWQEKHEVKAFHEARPRFTGVDDDETLVGNEVVTKKGTDPE